MISPIDFQGQEGFVKYVLQLELNRGSMGGNVLGNILALTDKVTKQRIRSGGDEVQANWLDI